jgi:putative transposase
MILVIVDLERSIRNATEKNRLSPKTVLGEIYFFVIIESMSIRNIPLVSNEYYHIYNRGNGKNQIFFDDEDYKRFIKLLFVCNSDKKFNFRDDLVDKNIDALDFERGNQLVYVGAWVLMPNHFHLYLSSSSLIKDENNITVFMRKLCTAYSKYINKKYNRTGSLFEGRFKSVHVEDEIQAKYLFSYIHLNPIKLIQKNWKEEGIKNRNEVLNFLASYKWGSYLDYLGIKRKENNIINRDNFLNYFSTPKSFNDEIFDWIISPKTVLGERRLE